MRLFNKVAIIGTGLVGGSLALAIKKNRLAKEVVGVSRHKSSILRAKKIGAIDRGSTDLSVIKGADLAIFALPVGLIKNRALSAKRFLPKECIVTDVGSTKAEIAAKLEKIFPRFIGTHPLAGSEKQGIKNAEEGLFRGSLCVLTPTVKTDCSALIKIKKLWKGIGARPFILNPSEHDRILSLTSHLPHAVAFSLIASIPVALFRFSAGGLKGTTRIAASEERLWADIFLSNRRNLLAGIAGFQKHLEGLASAVKAQDRSRLLHILRGAKRKRLRLQ